MRILASPKLVLLNRSSFTYIGSLGAQHFYGKLYCCTRPGQDKDWHEHELQYPMTQYQATQMNKADEYRLGGTPYKPRQLSTRFWSDQDVIDRAIAEYKKIFPRAEALMFGDQSTLDPDLVLDGPATFMTPVNALYPKIHELNQIWPRRKKECMRLCNRFKKLCIKHGYYS